MDYGISGIDINYNTVKDFIENSGYNNKYTITFYKNNNVLNENDSISNGTVMRVYDAEQEFYQDFIVVLYGDSNCDGKITSLDALDIVQKKINNEWSKFDNNSVYIEAARVSDTTRSKKSIPSSIDALAIVKDKLGTYTIKQ